MQLGGKFGLWPIFHLSQTLATKRKQHGRSNASLMEKYEFYFLGLTFTLLGASIQTVDFGEYSKVNSIIELVGWFAFGLSGVVGLSKIEYLASLIIIRNEKDLNKSYVSELQKARALGTRSVRVAQTGESLEIDQVISTVEANVSTWNNRLEQFGKWHEIKHIVQKYSFLIALFLVAFSRAYTVFASSPCSR
jgi:hypothetical protein